MFSCCSGSLKPTVDYYCGEIIAIKLNGINCKAPLVCK